MRDQNAQQLVARVMDWQDAADVDRLVPNLQLLADYKYDNYQRFGPGKRFIESLALWLHQFAPSDRPAALELVTERLVFISDTEFSHLVQMAYPDSIVQERMRLVAEEHGIASHRVGAIKQHPRFHELRLKSLYLGLSDGARTSELRRASHGEISNEQIWHAYELDDEKAREMVDELAKVLSTVGLRTSDPRFNLIWLLDDFSGSGHTYIRFDRHDKRFKGKIKKIYERLHRSRDLVDTEHYEVFLLLYVATRKAIDHIEYWSERFTSEHGYKPLQVRVLCPIEHDAVISRTWSPDLQRILTNPEYYDEKASDRHVAVGGTKDAQLGFAACALPLVLGHNTPNNSVYVLWGPESHRFCGLFPRVSRHREF